MKERFSYILGLELEVGGPACTAHELGTKLLSGGQLPGINWEACCYSP